VHNPKNIKVIVPEAKVNLFNCLKEIVNSTLSLASSIVISPSVELEGKTLSETSSLVSLDEPSAGVSLEAPSLDDPSAGFSLEATSLDAPSSGVLSLSILSLDILSVDVVLLVLSVEVVSLVLSDDIYQTMLYLFLFCPLYHFQYLLVVSYFYFYNIILSSSYNLLPLFLSFSCVT
jgi:hypothetical protein